MSLRNMLIWVLVRKYKILAFVSAICLLWMFFDASKYLSTVNYSESQNLWTILIVIILMPLNWGFETLKIYKRAQLDLGFIDCFKTVLKGLALSFFTPLGLGQFVGRMGHQSETNAIRLLPLSLLGSLIQTISNVSIGLLVGYPVYSRLLSDQLHFGTASIYFTFVICFTTIFVVIYILSKKESNIKTFVGSYFPVIHTTFITTKDILSISVYSMLRYIIFAIQFALLIGIHTDANWYAVISAVSLIYLIQSLIILPIALNGLIRGGIAVFVLDHLMESTLALGMSWTLFWINIGLPAILGIAILFIESKNRTRTNFKMVESYQKLK